MKHRGNLLRKKGGEKITNINPVHAAAPQDIPTIVQQDKTILIAVKVAEGFIMSKWVQLWKTATLVIKIGYS
jgi:hypothetical protein